MALYGCGNGLKHEQESYYPVSPPEKKFGTNFDFFVKFFRNFQKKFVVPQPQTMMDEKPVQECWGEPNPTEEWKKLRAEWEANKDKNEAPAE